MIRLPPQYFKVIPGYYVVAIKHVISHGGWKKISSCKDIIIQKADKGNSIVILNKSDYIKRMTEMLSDTDKFKNLIVKPGKELNLLLNLEDIKKSKNIL